jgi:predicted esterase
MKSQKILLLTFILCSLNQLFAQQRRPILSLSGNSDKLIKQIEENNSINTDSAYKLLNNWSQYAMIKETGHDYVYYYTDSTFGKIPLHVYIPANYKNTQETACVVLLHGAVGSSHFSDIDSLNSFDDDVLYNTLRKYNYIIIRPIADNSKGFNWVVNNNGEYSPNITFKALTYIMVSLKKILNIDDNKVFAFGHSDGSDGAVGLEIYSPDMFAGIVAYNSMLNNLFAKDFFIRNIKNWPLYIVHSDLDDLRPILQTRIIVDSLLKFNCNILYKEYIGYQHFDKHLDKDLPYACDFMKGISRNPFQSTLYWETDKSEIYNTVDWLKVSAINTAAPSATWHIPFNFKSYNKRNKQWMDYPYYPGLYKSTAVKATFNNNTFNIQTSDVKEIELLISPVMVNLENPVIVNVNGKQIFSGKILADKSFLLKHFEGNYDRQALWVNAIKIKIPQ